MPSIDDEDSDDDMDLEDNTDIWLRPWILLACNMWQGIGIKPMTYKKVMMQGPGFKPWTYKTLWLWGAQKMQTDM